MKLRDIINVCQNSLTVCVYKKDLRYSHRVYNLPTYMILNDYGDLEVLSISAREFDNLEVEVKEDK